MESLTISQVTRQLNITPRMLRHYEKLGLIKALHEDGYAYRMYDKDTVQRLQQIIVLRKLRIPLTKIATILEDETQLHALQIMRESITEFDEEIDSLKKIRSILDTFVKCLENNIQRKLRIDLLDDARLIEIISTLSIPKTQLKENTSMDEINKADEILNRNLNVRIVLLPPFTVASYHYIGENPEEHVGDALCKFVQDSGLYNIKPDSRMFGFNHPNPDVRDDGLYGYEAWVTIPDDMDVPKPYIKKKFDGGLFAAYTIRFPEFQYWQSLGRWAENNDIYEPNWSELGFEIMGGCLEEHLNWVYSSHVGWPKNGIDGQLDLMLPIRRKTE